MPSRIVGLDDILHGGIPEKRTTLVKGGAGTGKSILGLELLYRSAINGTPVIFVSFEETAEAVRSNLQALGWDIADLEEAGRFFLWEARVDRAAVISGDFTINSLLAIIKGKAEQMGARLIMIDAIDVLMRIFENSSKAYNELYRLHDWLVSEGFTTILTSKISPQPEIAYYYDFLDYMADCVLLLDLRVVNQIATRRLRVIKYRGSGFCSNEYPYIITSDGSVVMPVTAVQLGHQSFGEKITSGNSELDKFSGGGFHRVSSILLAGSTGTGKTTLAANFTRETCSRGRKVLYISFEESQAAIIGSMLSPGIDLRPAVENGKLIFHTVMPEALVPEEHLYRILQQIEQFQPDHIVLDAISACKRMGGELSAFDFLVRLVDFCKQQGITIILINQLEGNEQNHDFSGLGLSSIIDTVITVRYCEIKGRIERDLVVLKSRGANHSNCHHLYLITSQGIVVEPAQNPEQAG